MIKRTHILITSFLYLFTLFTLMPFTELYAQQVPCPDGKYCALSTIPGTTVAGQPADPAKIVKNIYGISIAIAAILAVGMIIYAGIEYATQEAIEGKSSAKKHWQGAIGGLILLLSSYLILRTINVDLVNIDLSLGTSQVCIDANGLPCGGSLGVLSLQERNRLATAIDQNKLTLTTIQETVASKQAELAAATAEEALKSPADTARLDRIENELKQAITLQTQTELSLQKNTAGYSVVTMATNGEAVFDTAKKTSRISEMQAALQTFQQISQVAISGMQNEKKPDDTPLFTSDQITKTQNEFNEQVGYMNQYISWQTKVQEAVSNGTSIDAVGPPPTQPTFELGI